MLTVYVIYSIPDSINLYSRLTYYIVHTCLYSGENVAAFSNTEDELNTGHTAKANGILK